MILCIDLINFKWENNDTFILFPFISFEFRKLIQTLLLPNIIYGKTLVKSLFEKY